MAIYYSAEATIDNSPSATTRRKAEDKLPVFRYLIANYTSLGTEVATEAIHMIKVPAGTTIIPELSYIEGASGLATAYTVDIGYYTTATTPVAIDINEWGTAVDIDTATKAVFAIVPVPATKTTVESWISLTGATVTTPIAGQIITMYLAVNMPY